MIRFYTFIFMFFLSFNLAAQAFVLPLWDVGNSNFAAQKRFSFNTSFTSRYNFNDKVQLASNILVLPLFPNLQAKLRWWNHYDNNHKKGFFSNLKFSIVSVHTLVYAGYGWNLLSRHNILPPVNPRLPGGMTMQNDLFLTFPTNASKVCHYSGDKLTIKAGFRYSFNADTTLILPQTAFWFLNTSTFASRYFYYAGISYDAKIFNNLNFSTSLKFYNIHKSGQVLENYSFLYFGFGMKKSATIAIGYIFDFWGQTKNYSILPAFNIAYKFQRRNKSDMDKYLRIYQ